MKEIKTRKLRVDFQKLINDRYSTEEMLLIYQWLIKIGRDCNKQYGWNRYGLHQSLHGYSYNNEPREVYPLSSDFEKVIYDGFVNLLCKTNNPQIVKTFLEENKIQIGKIRVLTITELEEKRDYFKKITNRSFWNDCRDKIRHITGAYKGLELKKELFHPEYTDRLKPRIINNVQFGTNYNKWYVWFNFSFECFDYENGWKYEISQEELESLPSFFDRAIETIDSLILYSDNCNNCPLWGESERGDYLRHGYKGYCKADTCTRHNVVKYKWWSEEGRIHDNATYSSIVFPYYRNR